MSVSLATITAMTDTGWPQQLPLIATAQLRARGWTPQQIKTSAGRGALVRIARGIYMRGDLARALAAKPDGEHVLRAAAAAVRAGPDAVVSHRSAAVIHGIDLLGRHVDVTITGPVTLGRKGSVGVHSYTTPLPAEHVTRIYGLPVTTVARTVIDLARTLGFVDGVVAADSAIRRRLTTKSELQAVLTAGPRRRGAAVAARVVAFATGLAESALESIARVAFAEQGLAAPRLQVWIPDANGDVIGRVDFYWEKYKTVAEVDGALKYQDDPNRARAQLRRDKRLREAGFEVVHFTWAEITTRPEEVAASIRAAFRAAARKARTTAA
jgi:predicted transcriptional regulator of viral defense system